MQFLGDESKDGRAQDFFAGIAEDSRRRLIPTQDVSCEIFAQNRVIRRLNDGCHFPETFGRLTLILFSSFGLFKFTSQLFPEAEVLHCDGCLSRNRRNKVLRLLLEYVGLFMAIEQASHNRSRCCLDGNLEITADGQMTFGHSMMRSMVAIPRVFGDIPRTHNPTSFKRRSEHSSISWHGKLSKVFAINAG